MSTFQQLNEADCQSIDAALMSHGVMIADADFDSLCMGVESDLILHVADPSGGWTNPTRADAVTDIARFQDALNRVMRSSYHVLREASLHTLAQRRVEIGAPHFAESLMKEWTHGDATEPEQGDADPPSSFFDVALSMLREACAVALRDKPPESIYGGGDILAANVSRPGRPTDWGKRCLVRALAVRFQNAARRPATDTEFGPFDDFLSACLSAIDPTRKPGTNRKLIRAALYDAPWHVPKPARNS